MSHVQERTNRRINSSVDSPDERKCFMTKEAEFDQKVPVGLGEATRFTVCHHIIANLSVSGRTLFIYLK